MKKLFTEFVYNFKMYCKYLMKVGFKELLIDFLILLLIVAIASFAYVPTYMLHDLVRSVISSFVTFEKVGSTIFDAIFKVIGGLCCLSLFAYLFNQRYDFKNDKVVPIEGSVTLDRDGDAPKANRGNKVSKDLDLPKVKEKEEK